MDNESGIVEQARGVYTAAVIDHAINPRNFEEPAAADGFAATTYPGGTTLKIWAKVEDNIIRRVSFWSDGCAVSIACGSIATGILEGKTPAAGRRITSSDIINALGGLPEGNRHCAEQAAETVNLAILDYEATRKEPWKRIYRKRDGGQYGN